MLALLFLALRYHRLPRRRLAPGAQELVEPAGVEGQLAVIEVQRRRRRGVQQLAVVADQHEAVPVAAQKALEPQRRFEIEMIGRLVEQQQVGLGKQHRRQRHPHAPAAGQFVERADLHCCVEPEPGEDAPGAGRRRAGADLVEAGLDLGDAQRRRAFGVKTTL